MALSGARTITRDGIDFQWKVHGAARQFIGSSSKTLRLIVAAPSGSTFMTQLYSKNWTREHDHDESAPLHKAIFTPGDVLMCIKAAIEAGWSPVSRARVPFVLDPAPEVKDYGPADAPKNLNPPWYGPCRHRQGMRSQHRREPCWECEAEEVREAAFRAIVPKGAPLEQEFCLACFKMSRIHAFEILRGDMPKRYEGTPWRIVKYTVKGIEGFGIACSGGCELRFYELVQPDTLNLYERLVESFDFDTVPDL